MLSMPNSLAKAIRQPPTDALSSNDLQSNQSIKQTHMKGIKIGKVLQEGQNGQNNPYFPQTFQTKLHHFCHFGRFLCIEQSISVKYSHLTPGQMFKAKNPQMRQDDSPPLQQNQAHEASQSFNLSPPFPSGERDRLTPPSQDIGLGDKCEAVEVDLIIIIYKMQNNQNQGLSKCDHHLFSLKALHKERRPNLSISVSLCRGKPSKGKKNSKCASLEAPQLNCDHCHATPAFVLPSEASDYANNAPEFLRDHQKKVREYEEEDSQLLIPKPRSKNMYCNVCRESYGEYLEVSHPFMQHIRSYTHRANVRACPFNNCILELQAAFRGNDQREMALSSAETGLNTPAEQEEGVGMRGRKRVKGGVWMGSNAAGSPPVDTYQHCTFTGSTQNLFYPQASFPAPMDLWSRLASCGPFYAPGMSFNPYLSGMGVPGGMGMAASYVVYCMPVGNMGNGSGAEWSLRQE